MNKYQRALSRDIKRAARALNEDYKTVKNRYVKGYSHTVCPHRAYTGCEGVPRLKRLNTAYHDKWSDYGYMCEECHEDSYYYYQELWDEYWRNLWG